MAANHRLQPTARGVIMVARRGWSGTLGRKLDPRGITNNRWNCLVKGPLLGAGLILALGVALFVAHYMILLQGDCQCPEHYRISGFRGHVVGKSLGVLQYRWLRRRFNATGTQLILTKPAPDSYYEDNLIKNSSSVGEQEIGPTGAFDFEPR